jgi:hypothetical protein
VALLVHGVVRADDASESEGATHARFARTRVVVAPGVGALVSDAPGELSEDDAVAHLELLAATVATIPILPVPFGTVAPDEAAVRDEVLLPAAEDLLQRLDAVADLVELRVDFRFDEEASLRAVAQGDSDIRRLAERSRAPGAGLVERMALGEAVAARLAHYHAALAEEWAQRLGETAERSQALRADERVMRTAFLVRRDRIAEHDRAVAQLRAQIADSAEV